MRKSFSCVYNNYMKNNTLCAFARALKALRREKGMNQIELGKVLNVTGATVSRWEAGMVEPDYQTLVNLCTFFSVSADFMLGLEEDLF